MYDYIFIKADAVSIKKTNLLNELNYSFKILNESSTMRRYLLRNLIITIKEDEILINGSICKFFKGTNQYTLTIKETEEAFKELSDYLKIPLDNFKVFSFEVGSNFIVNHDTEYYLQSLCKQQGRYKSGKVDTTTYFNIPRRKICFYDKIKELKKHEVDLIPIYRGKKLVRYELKFCSRVAEQFHRKGNPVTVKDLYNQEFYKLVLHKWKEEYFKLYKHKEITFEDVAFTDIRRFKEQVIILGIKALGGEASALDLIEQAGKKGIFKYSESRRRAVQFIKSICSLSSQLKTVDVLEEIDLGVNNEIQRQLSFL